MAWLLHNYYLPILNPPPIAQDLAQLRPLLPILKLYKETMKMITRDVSLVPKYRSMLVTVLRDLERWIAESKVAANVAIGEVGWTSENSMGGYADTKELWALEAFCDGLVEKGMLVPLSKKYFAFLNSLLPDILTFFLYRKRQVSDSLLPSKTSISLWEPLLRHVESIHPQFPHVLCQRLVSILISRPEDSDQRPDPTYDTYLACWVEWTVETWGDTSSEYIDLRKNALSNLVKGMFNSPLSLQRKTTYGLPKISLLKITYSFDRLRDLLRALSAGHAELEALFATLSGPQTGPSKPVRHTSSTLPSTYNTW